MPVLGVTNEFAALERDDNKYYKRRGNLSYARQWSSHCVFVYQVYLMVITRKREAESHLLKSDVSLCNVDCTVDVM